MKIKNLMYQIKKLNINNNNILKFDAKLTNNFQKDKKYFSNFWKEAISENNKIKIKKDRKKLRAVVENTKKVFLDEHSKTIYNLITNNKKNHFKINELVFSANDYVPYLNPSKEELIIENKKFLKDKDGIETDQGLFLSSILSHQEEGNHLCHSMLLPSQLAKEKMKEFKTNKKVQFDGASVKKYDKYQN